MRFVTLNLAMGLYNSAHGLVIRPGPASGGSGGSSSPLSSVPHVNASLLHSSKNSSRALFKPAVGLQLTSFLADTDTETAVDTGSANPTSGSWQSINCGQFDITNEEVLYSDRWEQADTETAWKEMVKRWSENKNFELVFVGWMSNQFNGSSGWSCQTFENIMCSTTVQCQDVSSPAGYMIMNALSGLYTTYNQFYNALDEATNDVYQTIEDFASVFAPQPEDNQSTVMLAVDLMTLLLPFGIASGFNGVWKGIEGAVSGKKRASATEGSTSAQKAPSNEEASGSGETQDSSAGGSEPEQDQGSSVDTDSIIPASPGVDKRGNFDWNPKGLSQDLAYNEMGSIAGWIKDNAVNDQDAFGTAVSIKNAAYHIRNSTKATLNAYIDQLFSGQNTDDIYGKLQNGNVQYSAGNFSLADMVAGAKKVVYGQLVMAAWATAPDNAGVHPFILKTDEGCGDNREIKPPGLDSWELPDSDAVASKTCYNQKTVYLLNAQERTTGGKKGKLNALPGLDQLSRFGGLTMEDIANSAMRQYEKNNANDLTEPDIPWDNLENYSGIEFGNIVQTPGFFQLPVCTDSISLGYVLENNWDASNKYWPCVEPDGYNGDGTNFHVNKGCIILNDQKQCGGSVNFADPEQDRKNSAMVYAAFDPSLKGSPTVTPGCMLSAVWNSTYKDVFFGEDNCLYDAGGNPIMTMGDKECCTSENVPDGLKVENPYVA
ncbi:hypothetical protein BDV59DRAFT_205096 [Aspergillus ambiguus]|uniref:uncharacterized protein n=1 Tax=Aspergillus ambiguus TaxID=176160 RepID=UPI003CCE0D27